MAIVAGYKVNLNGPIGGLNYELLEDAEFYGAPEYAGSGGFSRVENGRPILNRLGDRGIFVNDSDEDLSGLVLGVGLGLGSWDRYRRDILGGSFGDGRVVLKRGGAARSA